MLNAKALNTLLTANTDPRLCKKWYLMTPNGTLLAHTTPNDIKQLRRQAALTALTWQIHQTRLQGSPVSEEIDPETLLSSATATATSSRNHDDDDEDNENSPRTIIIEMNSHNTLIRRVQAHLILVLEAGVPPRKRAIGTRTWIEGPEGELQRVRSLGPTAAMAEYSTTTDENLSASISTLGIVSEPASLVRQRAGNPVLAMQRAKLDAMADALAEEFARSGFRMPREVNGTYF